MKNSIKLVLCFVTFLCFFMTACTSTMPVKDSSFFEATSLAPYNEVIQSDVSDAELYRRCRQFIVDEIQRGAFKTNGVVNADNSTTNMIRVPVTDSFTFKQRVAGINYDQYAYLEFTLILEFREGRMRFSLTDTQIEVYGPYDSYVLVRDTNIPHREDGKLEYYTYVKAREDGSELYKYWIERFSQEFNKIASGQGDEYNW